MVNRGITCLPLLLYSFYTHTLSWYPDLVCSIRYNYDRGWATERGRQSPITPSSNVKLEMEDKMVQKTLAHIGPYLMLPVIRCYYSLTHKAKCYQWLKHLKFFQQPRMQLCHYIVTHWKTLAIQRDHIQCRFYKYFFTAQHFYALKNASGTMRPYSV